MVGRFSVRSTLQLQSEPVSCCLGRWSHSLAVVAADGRFRVDNVRSGDYRISTTDLLVGSYLKDACLSERDVFNAPLPPS
jgi:hypothetical protein